VFAKTASGWVPSAELTGSDTVAGDDFGWSVAASGTTVVVGAVSHASYAGRAYVFTKTAASWKQVAELKGSDTVAGDGLGDSVALAGTVAVVGAGGADGTSGRAYVFNGKTSGWTQIAELQESDKIQGDNFGISVAISGATAVIGGTRRAYVFTKAGSTWNQVAGLKGSDSASNDQFGSSVAISGASAVVGAPGHASQAGRAYLFEA
jgi:FG-GAP repeat